MNTDRPAPRMVPLEPLVRGCGWEIAAPYHLPIEAGIRAEQARLRGRSWLVARHIHTIDYDMIWPDQVMLDRAFDEENDAIRRTEACRDEAFAEARASRADWQAGSKPALWPGIDTLDDRPVTRLECRWLHKSWWQGWEVQVAVFPINPSDPVNRPLIAAIAHDRELLAHFRKTGRG